MARARKSDTPVAADTLILGQHGEIQAGEEIPATFTDTLGEEHDTDFDRLASLGLIAGVEPEGELEPAPEPEPEGEPDTAA